jgi:high affinity sulfate transporter 1
MKLPLLTSFEGYTPKRLPADLIAGLTVWAVLVPEALAYATIAGVSPVVGLYAAPAALVLYAVFGSSRHLVVGPMAATAALSAAAIADVATDANALALTAGLAMAVGVLGLLAGLIRLGFLASFISEPVLKGFIIGLALTIIVGQLPKLFGVSSGEGDFFEKTWDLLTQLRDTQWRTLAVGAASLLVVVALRHFVPPAPAPLVAVILGIVAVSVFDLADQGVAIVGHIDSGLPRLGAPDLGWSDYVGLAGSAVGVLLVGFAEGLGAAKTYAQKDHYDIDPNKELIGLGAANLGSGLSAGMVVNGSLSKTAVNGSAGATSQLSGVFVAALTVLTLLFLTGLFENLPEATLAAVVVAAVVELVDVEALRRLWRVYTAELGDIYGRVARADLLAALAAMFGVLVFDTLPGLFIGIAVSVLLLVYRASRPHVAVLGRAAAGAHWVDTARHHDATTVDGILVLRPESGLFYANADNVKADVTARLDASTTAVVLDLAEVPTVDITAVDMLVALADDLDRRGIGFAFARDIGQVRDVLTTAGAADLAAAAHPTVESAVQMFTT